MVAMDLFEASNFYDFFNQYCLNLLKNPTVRGLKFLNPDPFTKRESAVSNFHTNLYGAIKSHNITAQSTPDFGHALFNPPPGTAHVSILFFAVFTKRKTSFLQLFSSLSTSYSGFRALKALTGY